MVRRASLMSVVALNHQRVALVAGVLLAATGCATGSDHAVLASANVLLAPDDAVAVTSETIKADPAHAPEIVAAAVASAPRQAAAITQAAYAIVPEQQGDRSSGCGPHGGVGAVAAALRVTAGGDDVSAVHGSVPDAEPSAVHERIAALTLRGLLGMGGLEGPPGARRRWGSSTAPNPPTLGSAPASRGAPRTQRAL
jgi:hypothetical protein